MPLRDAGAVPAGQAIDGKRRVMLILGKIQSLKKKRVNMENRMCCSEGQSHPRNEWQLTRVAEALAPRSP